MLCGTSLFYFILFDGAPGPLRAEAETLPSIANVRTSDNTDEQKCAEFLHPSRIAHVYLLGNRRVRKVDNYSFIHVTPDLVIVENTKNPNVYTVTLVDVNFYLEQRVAQAEATERSHYELLYEALRR